MSTNPSLDSDSGAKSGAIKLVKQSIVIVATDETLIGPKLRWPLRIAKRRDADINVIVCASKNIAEKGKKIDLSMKSKQSDFETDLSIRMRDALDENIGAELWTYERTEKNSDPVEPETQIPNKHTQLAQLQIVKTESLVGIVKRLTPRLRSGLVLFVQKNDPVSRKKWIGLYRELLRNSACSMAAVVPGDRTEDGEVLVATAQGPHSRRAINLGKKIASLTDRELTAFYVEMDIGPDAEDVGRRIIDRLMRGTIPEKNGIKTKKRVVVDNDSAEGIIRIAREPTTELLILGAARFGALGNTRPSSVVNKVLRARPEATVIVIRDTVPFKNRFDRFLEANVERIVPQLARYERIELVERIQSNSYWNFDFMLLIVLSTLIASLGLLDNSPSVIIGAMLVAPLMTPLIGLGLSISQGNHRLVKITLKASSLGFLTAFVVAFSIGQLAGNFYEATPAMEERDWPQMIDLVVAFVSGLAAAYASGRTSLLAALPGVAIAAALLPPVATAGLAMSLGDYYLAFGALLLFGVNIVAIVVSAAVSVWALGMRYEGKSKPILRYIAKGLWGVTIIMALVLTFFPPLVQAPTDLVEAVENILIDEYRVREIKIVRFNGHKILQLDLGGEKKPEPELKEYLGEVARSHLGENAGIRLTYRYEVEID